MRGLAGGVLLWVLLGAGRVLAQEDVEALGSRGQGWSALAAQTVGEGGTALVGQVGWPGLSLGLLRGLTPRLDVGGRLAFNYGREGSVSRRMPGLKLQAWTRLSLLELSRVSVGLHFAPGAFFYFQRRKTEVGLVLPVHLVVGVPVGSALMLHMGVDFPFQVLLGPGGGPAYPVLAGGGLEYFLHHGLAATFNVRMGPTLFPERGGRTEALFTLDAALGVLYRL